MRVYHRKLAVKLLHWWHPIQQWNWFAGNMHFVSKTDSLVTYNLLEKIGDRLINKTDLLKHRLVSELIRCNTNSLANWFAWSRIRQQNWWHRLINKIDLPKHRFINEVICYNTNSSANWFAEAQTCQQIGLLQHKLVSELICWNTKCSINWFAGTPQFGSGNCFAAGTIIW